MPKAIAQDKIDYIMAHQDNEVPKLMAQRLHITEQTIRNYLKAHGVKPHQCRWSADHKHELVRLVNKGASLYSLVKYFGLPQACINKEIGICKKQGLL